MAPGSHPIRIWFWNILVRSARQTKACENREEQWHL
jgi:hypothetical protein